MVFFVQHVNLQYVLYTVIMYTTYHNIAIYIKKHIYFHVYKVVSKWYVSPSTSSSDGQVKQTFCGVNLNLPKNPTHQLRSHSFRAPDATNYVRVADSCLAKKKTQGRWFRVGFLRQFS